MREYGGSRSDPRRNRRGGERLFSFVRVTCIRFEDDGVLRVPYGQTKLTASVEPNAVEGVLLDGEHRRGDVVDLHVELAVRLNGQIFERSRGQHRRGVLANLNVQRALGAEINPREGIGSNEVHLRELHLERLLAVVAKELVESKGFFGEHRDPLVEEDLVVTRARAARSGQRRALDEVVLQVARALLPLQVLVVGTVGLGGVMNNQYKRPGKE